MKKEYPIYLTKEELEVIPVIVNMAMIYSWELYNKKDNDKFYKQHQENIDLINDYHNKGYQGVLAVGSYIESKSKQVLKNCELEDLLSPYMNMNKELLEEASLYFKKSIEINNHIGAFNDEYIDFITIIYDEDKTYNVMPIDNKFTIPYVKSGAVTAFYKKRVKNVLCYTSSRQ